MKTVKKENDTLKNHRQLADKHDEDDDDDE